MAPIGKGLAALMRESLLEILRCPACYGVLEPARRTERGEIIEDVLGCAQCAAEYPVVGAIPRFAPKESYAANFGMQWNLFKRTQLDSRTGKPISRNRFFSFTGWKPQALEGHLVLDAGCGAGRFTEIAAGCGARVVAVDYSDAVDAARDNLRGNPDAEFVQADINALPFEPGTFSYVYCLGVLQHTPDPAQAFKALAEVTAAGGRLAVDVYPKLLRNLLFPKYWIRPLTKRLTPEKSLALVRSVFPFLYPVSGALARVPWIGRYIRHLVPVVNYRGTYDLEEEELRNWGLLDTFDMWAPAYDQPQSSGALQSWFEQADFHGIEIFRDGFLIGRGIKD